MTVIHNIFALSSLATFLLTAGVAPVAALTTPVHHARHLELAHGLVKRNPHRKRCKARPPPKSDPPPQQGGGGYDPPQQGGGGYDPPQQGGGGSDPPPQQGGGGYNPPPPPPPPPPQGGGGYTPPPSSSGKTGVGWPNGEQDLEKWRGLDWFYTWSPYCPQKAKDLGMECVPMCWGWNQKDQFIQLTSQPGYANVALGMNEPNQYGQSDMSPESGVELWLQTLQPLKAKGYRLGSPATTSAPNGKEWVKRFLEVCGGRCDVDFIALHWYDKGVQKFKDYVTDFHNTFNRNIWVTEYACQDFNGGPQCSEGEVWDFLQQTVQWMEATPWIERYAWFGAMHEMQGVNDFDQLMGYDGGMNALGNKYING